MQKRVRQRRKEHTNRLMKLLIGQEREAGYRHRRHLPKTQTLKIQKLNRGRTSPPQEKTGPKDRQNPRQKKKRRAAHRSCASRIRLASSGTCPPDCSSKSPLEPSCTVDYGSFIERQLAFWTTGLSSKVNLIKSQLRTFHQKSTCPAQLGLRYCEVQIRSRYPRVSRRTSPW